MLGIAPLDAEHRTIVAQINHADRAARESGYSSLVVFPLYVELQKTFDEHFAHEERVMVEYRYPEAQAHRDASSHAARKADEHL